jgi:hypothetical protein
MIFGKQKKSKQLSLVHIVNALQKEKIGDNDFLEEIKLDLQEDIPLSQKKVEYLKEEVRKLKEIKSQNKSKTDLPKDIELKKNVKPKKEKRTKKSRFDNILGRKNKKTSEDIGSQLSKPQNTDMDNQANECDLLQSEIKSNPQEQLTNSKIVTKNYDKQKRTGFFKLLSIKKKPHNVNKKLIQNETQSLSSQELENTSNIADFKDAVNLVASGKTETIQMNHDLPDLPDSQELEKNVEETLNAATKPLNESTYKLEKSYGNIKHVIDDLNKDKELLKTDIEEAKQLDDIKQLLQELSKEKEQLKTNVDEIKRRFNVRPLVKKYDDIEQRLQSATDTLYSIQSDIYERIREIRILRKDLSAIKEDLSSL